ncbi:MAG: hypothetical protein OXI37_04460, partial [Gammaproteobacteria bacterium]|nr:hypothetical protein [Gammaproteobacteria bacterium]
MQEALFNARYKLPAVASPGSMRTSGEPHGDEAIAQQDALFDLRSWLGPHMQTHNDGTAAKPAVCHGPPSLVSPHCIA